MASDTALRRSDEGDFRVGWSRRLSIRQRILAINIFAIAIIAGSLFYLDSFRSRLTQARIDRAQSEVVMIAHMVAALPPGQRAPLLTRLGEDGGTRLTIYGADGSVRDDSWAHAPPTYELRDPADEPWYRAVARAMDNGFDAIVGASRPPLYEPSAHDTLADWPEARRALASGEPTTELRRTEEGTPFVSAAARIEGTDPGVIFADIDPGLSAGARAKLPNLCHGRDFTLS